MYAHFRYRDGPRQGETVVVPHDFATIGRHPSSDLPFDATDEIRVSVRHAAVFKQGGGFLVRDLGSTNGTYLNSKRVRGDRPLEPNDILQFGPTGPTIEFTLVATLPAGSRIRPAVANPAPASDIIRPSGRTIERIRAEVVRQTTPWRWIAAVAVVELVQFAVLVPVAYALGWSPSAPNWAAGIGAVLLGTAAFAGLGLTMAGRLRGEINLAAQNALYIDGKECPDLA